MNGFSKKLLSFLILSLFFLSFTKDIHASVTGTSVPPAGSIDETTGSVTVTFKDLVPGKAYEVCKKVDANCVIDFHNNSLPDPSYEVLSDANGTLTFSFCGDGDSQIKINSSCGQGDYFHAGSNYIIALKLFAGQSIDGKYPLLATYDTNQINAYPPTINIPNQQPKPGDTIKISLQQDKMRPGGENRNKYKAVIADSDMKEESNCVPIKSIGSPIDLQIPKNSGVLTSGDHEISIRGCGHDQSSTYYTIQVHVSNDNGSIDKPIGITQFTKEGQEPSAPPAPCAPNSIVNGECIAVTTAIGNISTNPSGFVTSIFSLLLGISGGVALILIIISGYRLMTSQGNPEQIQGAREMLTSAIVGLLFIIFSFVILQVIGVNILHIPGFG